MGGTAAQMSAQRSLRSGTQSFAEPCTNITSWGWPTPLVALPQRQQNWCQVLISKVTKKSKTFIKFTCCQFLGDDHPKQKLVLSIMPTHMLELQMSMKCLYTLLHMGCSLHLHVTTSSITR